MSYVVIGTTNVARQVCASMHDRGYQVVHLIEPSDDELRTAMAGELSGVAVLLHDDVAALRYTLAAAHIAPATTLVTTIFDHTVSEQLVRLLPACHVISPAAIAVPSLVAPCLDPGAIAIRRGAFRLGVGTDAGSTARRAATAIRPDGAGFSETPWELGARARWRARLGRYAGQLRPHDVGTRIMLGGLVGILAVLFADWAWLVGGAHHGPVEAFYEAARVVTTVGPATAPHGDQASYLLLSAVAMLVTVVLTAVFTAGVVDRLLGPRLVGLVGPRALPRSGHVIVVGLGQVGLRLCQELQRLGVTVVGVERDPHAPNLRIARTLGVPIVVANGGDRAVLERLRLRQARALAAVGSVDLDNIAVAVTAHGVAPGTRVVLRAGEDEAIAETRSLLPLGATRDVTTMCATYVVTRLLGEKVTAVIGSGDAVYVEAAGGGFTPWPTAPHHACTHWAHAAGVVPAPSAGSG